jgi:hypothetical protein
MNATLTKSYESKAKHVRESFSHYRKDPIRLSDVRRDGKLFKVGDVEVSSEALTDLTNIFSIKTKLVDQIENDQEQWRPLQHALTNIKKDRTVTAVVNHGSGARPFVTKFIDKPIEESEPLNLNRGVELIGGYLETAEGNLEIRNFMFNPDSLSLEIQIQDRDNNIDVFGDGNDIWNPGFGIHYGENRTSVAPYYLRLICTNGMTAAHEILQRYFNNKDMKQDSFTKLINNVVDRDMELVCRSNASRLKGVNASLREFFDARNILSGKKDLMKEYFDDGEIQEAYKPYGIRYRNKRWLSSANSNVNGYDLFNRLTHAATHKATLPMSTKTALNALASELFFKGPDIAFQAPNPFGNN